MGWACSSIVASSSPPCHAVEARAGLAIIFGMGMVMLYGYGNGLVHAHVRIWIRSCSRR